MKGRNFFTLGILVMIMALAPVFLSYPVRASTTWVVNSLGDVALGTCSHGWCSIRDAIALASSGDTITFSVTGTINLNNGVLKIEKDLTINGPGAGILSINGTGYHQVFQVLDADLTLTGLTITHGNGANSGAISNEGWLVLDQCTISDSTATGDGGGLYNTGTAIVNRSTFLINHAVNGGGIMNDGDRLSVTNSTFNGNMASSKGGGIDSALNSSLDVTNSTFKGNSAPSGGGIGNLPSLSTAENVLMAGNSGGNCSNPFATSGTHNLATDTTCSPGFNQVSLELLALGDLTSNPAYYPLKYGSVAIDTGTNDGCPALDETSKPRPLDGDDDKVAVCDVGAYEAWPVGFGPVAYLPFIMR